MNAAAARDTRFRLTHDRARDLAAQFGTPLYVIDEAHLRARIRRFRSAFQACYEDSEIAFASKANSTLAVLAIAASEGCLIDVASEGELRAAMAAGVPASRCHLHGSNKQRDEIEFAVRAGIGQIVVDHFGEIEMVADLLRDHRPQSTDHNPQVVVRLAPGVDPITHKAISTGQADTKFGFSITDGSAERATVRCLESGLPLVGYHCHVGSQLLDPEAQRSGGELIARFAREMRNRHGFQAQLLNFGGGLGVTYIDEQPIAVEEYCEIVVSSVLAALGDGSWRPKLAQEPGRALVAESGVTLYRVGPIKTVPAKERGTRTYVSVDGGLSDNPRPALYGARYAVEAIPGQGGRDALGPAAQATVSGKHCETDLLFEDVTLPADLQEGDLVQVLSTGAYSSSMASNYNRYPRPATVLVRPDGSYSLAQRRETWEEMLAREIVPEGLA